MSSADFPAASIFIAVDSLFQGNVLAIVPPMIASLAGGSQSRAALTVPRPK
jgi:hypothetical protein